MRHHLTAFLCFGRTSCSSACVPYGASSPCFHTPRPARTPTLPKQFPKESFLSLILFSTQLFKLRTFGFVQFIHALVQSLRKCTHHKLPYKFLIAGKFLKHLRVWTGLFKLFLKHQEPVGELPDGSIVIQTSQ
jgi:hypothetical protein